MPDRAKLLELIAIQTEVARRGLDLGEVMDVVAQGTVSLVGAEGAAIELAEGLDMVYRAAAGSASGSLGLRLKRKSSLSGRCVDEGHALRCSDAWTDPRTDQPACRKLGVRSMIVVPLRHINETVGVLKAMSSRVDQFDERDVHLLEMLSDLVAAAMYHATRLAPGELFRRATHDSLTDLANRSMFLDRARSALALSIREGRRVALLMLDLDGLKPINDRYGHRAGDAVLCEFARRLKSAVRKSDTAARLGGDEFGVLLHPLALNDGLEFAVARLEKLVNGAFEFEGSALPIKASVGGACSPVDGAEIDVLLALADQRMYASKRMNQLAAPATLPTVPMRSQPMAGTHP